MTVAQRIANLFRNDGQCFEVDGVGLSDICADNSAYKRDPDRCGTTERYTFRDGSVITICGDGWDFGYPDCFCWHECGHTEECAGDHDDV